VVTSASSAGVAEFDLLDDFAHPSARTTIPDLQRLEVGQWGVDVTDTIGADRV
jgi:hypothetical protein